MTLRGSHNVRTTIAARRRGRQAHIHLGYAQNAANIVLWGCDLAAAPLPVSPVESTPLCVRNDPTGFRNGTVAGTLTEADVITQTANGIDGPADWAEVVALIQRRADLGERALRGHRGR